MSCVYYGPPSVGNIIAPSTRTKNLSIFGLSPKLMLLMFHTVMCGQCKIARSRSMQLLELTKVGHDIGMSIKP